jgi:pSer/pThr/pTyr-binding forkhead associated (FHA) protein
LVLTESILTRAYPELYTDDKTGKQFTLGDALPFGRNPDNDVILYDDQVSRHHARITRHGERFLLEDLSSSNGTFLREQRRAAGAPSELADGDEIQIGSARLIFHLYRFISSSCVVPCAAAGSQNDPTPAPSPQRP